MNGRSIPGRTAGQARPRLDFLAGRAWRLAAWAGTRLALPVAPFDPFAPLDLFTPFAVFDPLAPFALPGTSAVVSPEPAAAARFGRRSRAGLRVAASTRSW
ncbi:MAG: hypothetical protein M3462_11985 [Chloroflexota bacterium]|nr:hypothetical protein [Chloroflexota bacterium]